MLIRLHCPFGLCFLKEVWIPLTPDSQPEQGDGDHGGEQPDTAEDHTGLLDETADDALHQVNKPY